MTIPNVNLLVAHDPGMAGQWVTEHFLLDAGLSVIEVVDSLSADLEAVRSSDADVLVVACSEESDDALELVSWWAEHRHGRPVVVLCGQSPNGFVQRAFSAGADDLVVLEQGATASPESVRNVSFALHKAMARKATPGEREASRGTTICVLGPKGGVGKTVASCNLAVALAEAGQRVALVDLDLQFGDVALVLGLRPATTVYDLMVSGGSLDAEKVEAYLTPHRTGLRVLAAPVRPDQADTVTPEFTAEVTAMLQTSYDYVVVDTPPSFSAEVISTIDTSTYVCMVGMLDASSLKNTRLGLETLELMGYPSDRIRVLLNRANTSVGITGNDVVNILGQSPDVLVPSSRDIARSVNEGEPIVLSQKRSETAKSFNALAQLFVEEQDSDTRKQRTRVFRRRSRG
jgi:pilus assembly protein CpaE